MKLALDDSRRLTGKGFIWDHVGAILDTFVSGIDKQQVVDCWQRQVDALLQALGWHEQTTYRLFENGISFLISAPIDALYAATEINEAAWLLCCAELNQRLPEISLARHIQKLKRMIEDEANPQLLAFIKRAQIENVPYLIDEDISLGYGVCTQIWPLDALPVLDEINWQQYHRLPVAMITGTNGKSTSVRLTAEMVKASGKCCGVSSTDFIKVGDQMIDEGDYSGPIGACMILRHPQTEMALLEVARGGLLRRGLAVPHIDAALITNIAEDHFGQYGINTLEALTQAKCIVAKGLTAGTLVLNADDAQLVKFAHQLKPKPSYKITWFSLDAHHPVLVKHRQEEGITCYLSDGQMVYQDNHQSITVIAVNDVAMTFKGAARHNCQNALGAIALACALKIDITSIRQALKQFNSDMHDNPGRGNRFQLKGAEVIVDFAHNPHSMQAMAETIKGMPAKRRLLLLSAAGDRSDRDIREMTAAAMKMKPDVLVVAELENYLRGRALSETPQIIAKMAMELGLKKDAIIFSDNPFAGAKIIVEQIKAQELALIMALSQRDEISQLLLQSAG